MESGERPDVSAYLERVDAPLRAELLRELVVLEVAYRHRAGEEVTLAEYERRFPDDADALQAARQLLLSWRDQDTEVRHADHAAETRRHRCRVNRRRWVTRLPHTTPTQFGRYQIQAVLGVRRVRDRLSGD